MNIAATRGQIASLLNLVPQYEPGALIKDLVDTITSQVKSCSNTNKQFHVKICIDDCEVLRKDQQTFINALVRKSKSPLFGLLVM